jgi:formylglycine-generating enzyme required for sulfatase activity
VSKPRPLDLLQQLHSARRRTDDLFAVVKESALYDRPIAQRHRLVFYLGHLEAFDWNHIGVWGLQLTSANSNFDRLFEAGIDPDNAHLPTDRPADWPRLDEVRHYGLAVRARLDNVLHEADPWLVQMAIEHRLMHAETLIYLLHNLATDSKVAPQSGSSPAARRKPLEQQAEFIEIPAGVATLGRRREDGFGWDNEFDEHQVPVGAFALQRFKVTNGEWLEFVRQGGPIPHYWIAQNGSMRLRRMFDTVPLLLDHPVFVTHEQAADFSRWRGHRLMTEAEFHRAAYGSPEGKQQPYPWGGSEPAHGHGNFDGRCWGTVPVDSTPGGDSAWGASQLAGNGWEWTSTEFGPFAGFKPAPNYPGYSANFFDAQHMVMKGASPATDRCLLRRSFRNWFRTDYPYVYASFRCVQS